jgi:hypothetical protein
VHTVAAPHQSIVEECSCEGGWLAPDGLSTEIVIGCLSVSRASLPAETPDRCHVFPVVGDRSATLRPGHAAVSSETCSCAAPAASAKRTLAQNLVAARLGKSLSVVQKLHARG